MPGVQLYDYQIAAIRNMKNGCILCGGVGSGKSRTALAYYYLLNGGKIDTENYFHMDDPPKDLYIITTARKRDTLEWDEELSVFLLSTHDDVNLYGNKVVIDSWNNIKKYEGVTNAFFIFDEQRVVGYGAWVKSFLKISKANQWILLSATPGDTWQDYIPVFIANGFYKNKTEFVHEHIVYDARCKFPRVDRYLNTGMLVRYRNDILVTMEFDRHTSSHHEDVITEFDSAKYKEITKTRWNPYTDEPIINAGELCYVWRKLVNSDESRQMAVLEIFEKHPRLIIFYNFDYELDLLRKFEYGTDVEIAEWNGHNHQPLPDSKKWVYLVQYTAGCEGWNCIKTDSILFYSQNYSYKVMVQAAGRIDRLNTPFNDLYFYHLKSHSPIDLAISKAIKSKKNFQESGFVKGFDAPMKNNSSQIAELIAQRRRQLLVHSVIYYRMNDNIISDDKWLQWAKELVELQSKYPEIAQKQPYAEAFADFDASTGCNLPLDDPWAIEKAQYLLDLRAAGRLPEAS